MLPKLVAEYDSESRTPIRRAARSAAHPGLRSLGPGPGPRVEPAPLSADPGPAGALSRLVTPAGWRRGGCRLHGPARPGTAGGPQAASAVPLAAA